ncbi:uncharacterized protein LOC113324343 [Papaver somniferum]|uniref:uncharacterized protein LOC113324343 n=1 Tax=Papaver somniferum TaxID=3469 RepID=UPI000E704DC3|nr:uncharacterized protein LOC113324343 [Papaver somniferum]
METLELFPSESEMIASSALLSLSSQKSSATNYCFISSISSSSSFSSRFSNGLKKIYNNNINEEANKSFISDSKSDSSSSSSALTTTNYEEAAAADNNIYNSFEDSVSPRSDNPLRFLSIAANFHEINNLKVVKKSRSKIHKICDIQNKNYKAAAVARETSKSESATSTLSSEPSVVSRQSHISFDRFHAARRRMRRTIASTASSPQPSPELVVMTPPNIIRQAEAILKVLSANSAAISEIEIGRVLGDNPTTSKALRILLKGKVVKRFGAGGYSDPYIYMVEKEVVMLRREHSVLESPVFLLSS